MSRVQPCPTPDVPFYSPSWANFHNFTSFIHSTEVDAAHLVGAIKVRPPEEWIPRASGYSDWSDIVIDAPAIQKFTGIGGVHYIEAQNVDPIPVEIYRSHADSSPFSPPSNVILDKTFWEDLTFPMGDSPGPIYGAGVPGTLFDRHLDHWNFANLDSILQFTFKYQGSVLGVNLPALYFGSWRTAFAWHVEDRNLYSINYLHTGAPKTWYVLPPRYSRQFEQLAATLFPAEHQGCPGFITHKTTLISPDVLAQHGLYCHEIIQRPGDIIITYPRAYHAGFNHGFNVAEAVNFATPRWIDEGKHFIECSCSLHHAAVHIRMDPFIRRFQGYTSSINWALGSDYAPFPATYAPYHLTAQDRRTIDRQRAFHLHALPLGFFK